MSFNNYETFYITNHITFLSNLAIYLIIISIITTSNTRSDLQLIMIILISLNIYINLIIANLYIQFYY